MSVQILSIFPHLLTSENRPLARISHQGAGWRFPGSCLHRIRASLHIIAQGFGFTRDFLKERNNSAYCRLKKIPCGFKEQARA
ncbi:MAG: hypothetical protein O6938_02505, partial [Gammaproteobacteria bacterium]|nr:hypothetical protein [Gammaproteobacteria bacterium]